MEQEALATVLVGISFSVDCKLTNPDAMSQVILGLLDRLEKTITNLGISIKKSNFRKTESDIGRLRDFSNLLKESLPEDFVKANFNDFERHLHFMEHYLKKKDFEWIQSNFDDIKERDFPSIKSKIYSLAEVEKSPRRKLALSKKVFIVHGRNHEPMKKLKVMLEEFGLNPIVLHEQPSASRTIVEKLEKYSDVGFAFVILTPDDLGSSIDEWRKAVKDMPHFSREDVSKVTGSKTFIQREMMLVEALRRYHLFLKTRARQNVVLEFGYFIGLLGRDRVCCLYKRDVELPSDMQGIVYIPFKDSVNEAREMLIKELKEAGYEIKL